MPVMLQLQDSVTVRYLHIHSYKGNEKKAIKTSTLYRSLCSFIQGRHNGLMTCEAQTL